MAGFTFCCGDFGPAMEAKGTVTNEICEMVEEDPRVCYINADGTATGGRDRSCRSGSLTAFWTWAFRK